MRIPGIPGTPIGRELLAAARKTNADRDESDRQAGFATPATMGPTEVVRIAMTAIGAALATQDMRCAAEALAMMQDCEELWRVRT